MNSYYLNKNAIYFELAFTLHTWFIIAVGDDDIIIDLICCWAGCYLSVISFSFFLHQLVWKPGRVFPHQRRTVAEFSPPCSHVETSREAGARTDSRWRRLGATLKCMWRCWESFCQMLQKASNCLLNWYGTVRVHVVIFLYLTFTVIN